MLIDLIIEQYKTCVQIILIVCGTGSGSYMTCVCSFFLRTIVARYVEFGAEIGHTDEMFMSQHL
jgi:hypothetical protein